MNLILYHANCLDGIGAAWAAWMHFKNIPEKTRYIPVQYGDALPMINPGDTIYILDFSYPPEQVVEMAKKTKAITLIDHHITAQNQHGQYWTNHALPDNVIINFDQAHSGCVLAWQHFHADKPTPPLLDILEDRDLWRFRHSQTKAVTAAIWSKMPLTVESLDNLCSDYSMEGLERIGVILLEQTNAIIARLKTKKHRIRLGNARGLAVNAPTQFSSELGHALAEECKTFGVTYQYLGDKGEWLFSIRSTGDYDVAVIAQQYGGGGHKNAAGFSLNWEQFTSVFADSGIA